MDLYKIQQNILRKAKIDPQKVNAWIYNNQSIVFDFLLNDYFVSVSYTVVGQTFNFIERNKSKVSQISGFPKFLNIFQKSMEVTRNRLIKKRQYCLLNLLKPIGQN